MSRASLGSRLAWAAVALYVVVVVVALRLHATMMGIGPADAWVYISLLWGAISRAVRTPTVGDRNARANFGAFGDIRGFFPLRRAPNT